MSFEFSVRQLISIPFGQQLQLFPSTTTLLSLRVLTGQIESLGSLQTAGESEIFLTAFDPLVFGATVENTLVELSTFLSRKHPKSLKQKRQQPGCCTELSHRLSSDSLVFHTDVLSTVSSSSTELSSIPLLKYSLRPMDNRLDVCLAAFHPQTFSLNSQRSLFSSVIMLIGPVDSGKSILSQILVNRFQRHFPQNAVWMIDTDVGQQSLGLPGSVTVGKMMTSTQYTEYRRNMELFTEEKDVRDWNRSNHHQFNPFKSVENSTIDDDLPSSLPLSVSAMYWVGDNSCQSIQSLQRFQQALHGVQQLLFSSSQKQLHSSSSSSSSTIVIVNTGGCLNKGTACRAIEWIYQLLQVTDVVEIHSGHLDEQTFSQMPKGQLNLQRREWNQVTYHTLSRPLDGVRRKSTRKRRENRTRQWLKWFEGSLRVSRDPLDQHIIRISPSLKSLILYLKTEDLELVEALSLERISVKDLERRLREKGTLPAAIYPAESVAQYNNDLSKFASLPIAGCILILSANSTKLKILSPAPGPLPSKLLFVGTASGPPEHRLPLTVAEP